MPVKLVVLYGKFLDVFHHLAVEQYLLETLQPRSCMLYLWQSDRSVLIGRNQIPWKETRPGRLERNGVALARRVSGGGAVYHDLGNLNFSFIMDKELYDRDRNLVIVLKALKSLGIDATINNRHDLVIGSCKFSGNAYRLRKQAALHHGTLLVNSNLDDLERFLQPSFKQITDRSTKSVRSDVVNLVESKPDLIIPEMKEAIQQAFKKEFGASGVDERPNLDQTKIDEVRAELNSWEWRFGKTPKFEVSVPEQDGPEKTLMKLTVYHGIVEQVSFSKKADKDADIQKALQGCRFNSKSLFEKLRNFKRSPAGTALLEFVESTDL